MNEIIIRKARLDDLGILLEFEQGVVEAERPMDVTLKGEGVKYYDIKKLITSSDSECLVAESSKQVIGSGYVLIKKALPYLVHDRFGYLGFMYVDPAFRRRGVNQMILKSLMNWCKGQGLTELRLGVYETNEGAIKAYEKVGFAKHLVEMRLNLDDVE